MLRCSTRASAWRSIGEFFRRFRLARRSDVASCCCAMRCFSDAGDLLSPNGQCRAKAETQVIVSVGDGTDDALIVADQSPVQADSEVWVLL